MTEGALIVRNEMSLSDTMNLGKTLAQSGYFSDAKQAAQAVVKVLAGQELGFGPIASMTGIHIVSGKPSLGANLIAAKIKGSGRYTYKIITLDNTQCELAFYESGQELNPRSLFTMEDAQRAGLTTGKNAHSWNHYPRNMLFARAISNGARWHCPDLFSGAPVYTPEELGAEVNGETGEIIDVVPTMINGNGDKPHWIKDDKIRVRFWAWSTGDREDSMGLTNAQVHEALGVKHVEEYAGTMADAKQCILDWIDAQIENASENQELEPEAGS